MEMLGHRNHKTQGTVYFERVKNFFSSDWRRGVHPLCPERFGDESGVMGILAAPKKDHTFSDKISFNDDMI